MVTSREKRNSERRPSSIDADIKLDSRNYHGVISNISECGIGCLMSSFNEDEEDFTPSKTALLSFKIPTGEMLSLTCEVKWFVKPSTRGEKCTMGLQIINPPMKYRQFVTVLFSNN